MSAEKNVHVKPVNLGFPGLIVKSNNGIDFGFADSLYRLIEIDEGIPFHLVFGDEPGNGSYLFLGEGIKKLTDIDADAFRERYLIDIIEEVVPLSENLPADIRMLQKMLQLGEIQEYKIEMRIRTRSGERKWIRETSIACSEGGIISGVIGILHDITEKKINRSLLDEAIRKAGESDRLKETFLQNISHEVRTPLNAIVGFSTLLCEPGQEYGRKEEFAKMINTSTDDFLYVMENIIEISRIEAGSATVNKTNVKAATVLRRIYNIFREKVSDNNILLECSIPEDACDFTFETDGYKLFQILYNLVGNATKFTYQGKISLGLTLKKSHVEFYVTDTGIGIPDHQKNRIFNKFYQADSGSTRRFPGVGLGLTISKAYTEMLGGSITFRSDEGKGSTFLVALPD